MASFTLSGSSLGRVLSLYSYLFRALMVVSVIMRAGTSLSLQMTLILYLLSNDDTESGPVVDEFTDV